MAADAGAEDSAESSAPQAIAERDYQIVLTQAELDIWLARIEQADIVALDTETTSLDYMDAQLVGLSLAVTVGEAAYIPVAHDYMGAPTQLTRDDVLAQLRPFLESPAHRKVGQNLKYDMNVLANYGIELQGISDDHHVAVLRGPIRPAAMIWTPWPCST